MSTFKCKMCGGTLEIEPNETIATCEYCGTQQTLPKLDDERRANLYDRANHFRRNNEFDKAMGIYEKILNEDNTDAEAYWSLVLCRYGIEYVEDPASHKRVPTVNRAQFTSIYDDDNYKSALQYADSLQRSIYEAEAATINEIQKGILEISSKEEPFDVFICYKESDASGRRTPDSVLATELYHELTNEGFKVFFSRITLEDKLGTAYEPYIFAALNSAKVMVVLGTKPEYFNAVWVKNEWSRYLALIKAGQKKILIPAYKDMDPYDLPEEFSHLQAQDMTKLGFMQDLIRGIKKILYVDDPKPAVAKETVTTETATVNTAPLLKRAFMFLEDGNWRDADAYCEKVLDQDPENAEAYLGKLMAELHVRKRAELQTYNRTFTYSLNYQKIVRFGNKEKDSTDLINDCRYQAALSYMSAENYDAAITEFEELENSIQDTDLRNECEYQKALALTAEGKYDAARKIYKILGDYKDSAEKITEVGYQSALAMMDAGQYENAISAFKTLNGYKDSASKIEECTNIPKAAKYNKAVDDLNSGNYVDAYETFMSISDYKDSKEKASEIYEQYKSALLKEAAVGSIITFGSYEQDGNTKNGADEIEWIVLEEKDNKLLVISRKILDVAPFNSKWVDSITWEKSTLRKWLNSDFYNSAFTASEKSHIQTVTVTAEKNSKYNTPAGSNTQDKIFLLSISEAETYFGKNRPCGDGSCEMTDWARYKLSYLDHVSKSWWLRTPGQNNQKIAYYIDNTAVASGSDFDFSTTGVRPAMWISLNS